MQKRPIRVLILGIIAVISLSASTNLASAAVSSRLSHGWVAMEPRAQKYLVAGYSAIEAVGPGTLALSGTTLANQTVERIGVTLYLQVYDNNIGVWEDAGSWPFSKISASAIESSVIVPVRPGRIYRVRGYHEVLSEGNHESGWSVTSGISAP